VTWRWNVRIEPIPYRTSEASLAFIAGELRVGVSRLQVVKALGEVAGVEESRMAQRMIGYAALDAGRPYPFYLARPWQQPARTCRRSWGR
jgi:hypothetical protein